MWNLVSLGELLVDFTPMGMSTAGNPVFERNPGGGPTNLACAAAKLGVRTAFIGQVGEIHSAGLLRLLTYLMVVFSSLEKFAIIQ